MIETKLPNGKTFRLNNFSSSQLRLIKTCPKKWQLQKQYGIPIKDNLYFAKGRILHEVIENLHRYMLENDQLKPVLDELRQFLTERLQETFPYSKKSLLIKKKRAKAEENLNDKQLHIERLDTLIWQSHNLCEQFYNSVDYEVLAVEQDYEMVWCGILYKSAIDLLIKRNDLTILVDLKTKSANTRNVDIAQFATYVKTLREAGIELNGIEQWDAVYTAEPKIEKFKIDQQVAEDNIELLTEDLQNALKMIETGIFPRNEYHNTCSSEMCPVWDYCRNPGKLKELENVGKFHQTEVTGYDEIF